MTGPTWSRAIGARAALVALAVAILVTGWTVVEATRVEALPESPQTTLASLESIKRASVAPPADVGAAVGNRGLEAELERRGGRDFPIRQMRGE